MAYVALYRAYRPQKFSEVVGQQHIIKTLQNAIKLNKVAHAYLFCGPRGTGKTTLAKIMAKALNCEHGPSIEPCDECNVCKGIQRGTVSDVIEIDAASNNGADDIRALRDTVKFLPAVGKYKVYIIDEVHMLSNAAFNALLKTLEEPPAHVIFILATTEPYKLPNTILSRCQRFDFQSISISNISSRLELVAKEENVQIEPEAINQIAASAEGGMRDALSLFDQCISYSVNPVITLDDIINVSGNISYIKIIELLNACISNTETDAVLILDGILKEGKEVPRIVNDIILFLRDVLLFKNNAVLESKLMFDNAEFKALASNLPKGVIYQWLNILNDTLNQMRFSTQKRSFLELTILKMNDIKLNEEATLLDRITSLEHTIEMLSHQRMQHQIVEEPKVYNPSFPSKDDYDMSSEPQEDIIEEKPVMEELPKPIFHDEIMVKDIVRILNHASKEKKEKLQQVWNVIADKYTSVFAIQIMVNGQIVAVSDDAFIVVLQDVGFCNRVMLYENYVKIMEIFKEMDLNIRDYICIPLSIWNKIRKEFSEQYKLTKSNEIELEEFPLGIKKRVIPASFEVEQKALVLEKVKEYFENENLKILEE